LNAGKQLIPNKSDTIEPPMNDTGSSSLPDATNESPHLQSPNNPPDVSRYGQVQKPTQRMQESREQRGITFSAYYDAMHEADYLLQDEMMNPVAFITFSNQDTMYFHQAMKAPDRKQFTQAIIKEVNDHIENKNWELIPRDKVPKSTTILPSVWSMKCKRDIKTQQVYKHKARLNVHGGKQVYGENYFNTFALVVTWFSI
jgi:hypothetical protein